MVLLFKSFSTLSVLILEERLNVDISFNHLFHGVRLFGNFLSSLVALNMPVFGVLVIYFMHLMLLFIVTMSSMLMEGHWLLLMRVISMFFSIGSLESFALLREPREVSWLTLLLLFVLSNSVGISRSPC